MAKSSCWVLLTYLIVVKGGDSSGKSETDEISQRRGAKVIAHRSPHGGQQDVGHDGVATQGGVLSHRTFVST